MATKIKKEHVRSLTHGKQADTLHTLLTNIVDRLGRLETTVNRYVALSTAAAHNRCDSANFISTTDAYDLDSAVALANELSAAYTAHCAEDAAHSAGADATNAITAVDATDLASLLTLVNDIKAQYEAHRVLTTTSGHAQADNANAIAAADATDLAEALTLVNEIKDDFNSHIEDAKGVNTAASMNEDLLD